MGGLPREAVDSCGKFGQLHRVSPGTPSSSPGRAIVITGLDPVIHVFCCLSRREVVDTRVKPGHDGKGGRA